MRSEKAAISLWRLQLLPLSREKTSPTKRITLEASADDPESPEERSTKVRPWHEEALERLHSSLPTCLAIEETNGSSLVDCVENLGNLAGFLNRLIPITVSVWCSR